MRTLFIFLFLFGSLSHADPQSACSAINTYLGQVQLTPAEELAHAAADSSDLVLLGETHGETDPPYPLFIKSFNRAHAEQKPCLILEAKACGYSDSNCPEQKSATEITSANWKHFSELNCSQCQPWRNAVIAAQQLGWKVFSVDSVIEGWVGADYEVQLRDDLMAPRIAKLFTGNICASGIGIFGKHHLMTGSGNVNIPMRPETEAPIERRSLVTQLKKQIASRISTVDVVMNVQDYGFELNETSSADLLLCNSSIQKMSAAGFGWYNPAHLKTPIYPFIGSKLEFYSFTNEFSYTILSK